MTSERPADGHTSGSPELRRLNLAMLCAALAAFALLYSTQALLPAIGAGFGVGPTASSLTVSAATGALALAILPLSSAAESYGRVPVMRAGLLGACLFTFAAAAAPQFWLLLVARALVGVSLAAVVAVAVAHLGDEVHPDHLGGVIGVYVAGNTLGGISGRLVPGLVEESTSWRAGITLLGVVATVAALLFARLVPAADAVPRSGIRAGEHVRLVRDVVREAGILRLCAVAFLLMGGFVACYNYLTFRLEGPPLHLSTTVTSMLFLAYLAGTVSSPLAGLLSDRFGRRRLAVAGVLVSLAGLAATLQDRVWVVAVGLLVFTAGFFATHSVASTWVSSRAAGRRGQGAAVYLMSYYLGSSVLGASIGPAYSSGGWPAAAAAVGVLFALGGALLLWMPSDPTSTRRP